MKWEGAAEGEGDVMIALYVENLTPDEEFIEGGGGATGGKGGEGLVRIALYIHMKGEDEWCH